MTQVKQVVESHSQDKGRSASLGCCGDRPLHGHLGRHPSSRRRSAHAGVPQGGVQGSVPRMVARRGRWLQRFVHEIPVTDPSIVLPRVPTPESLKPGDERLGWGDGLKAGYKAGVDFGVELGRAARTPQSYPPKMEQATEQLHAYVQTHCAGRVAALDWETTFMNKRGSSTVASLNEAQVAMGLASNANQAALGAEELARGAREAEAKGDQLVALSSEPPRRSPLNSPGTLPRWPEAMRRPARRRRFKPSSTRRPPRREAGRPPRAPAVRRGVHKRSRCAPHP